MKIKTLNFRLLNIALLGLALSASAFTTASYPLNGGTTSLNGGSGPDDVVATATPNPGFVFIDWTFLGTNQSSNAVYSFPGFIYGGSNILVANFGYTVSVSASGEGVVTGRGRYVAGSEVVVTAEATSCSKFVKWTQGGKTVSTSNVYTFTLNQAVTLTADFSQIDYKVSTSVYPTNYGTVSGAGIAGCGDSMTLKAKANPGFKFTEWINVSNNEEVVGTNASLTFEVTNNSDFGADFIDIQPPTVKITTKAGAGSNSVVAVTGTAKDNVGVSNVWYQVDNSGWNLASTSDAYTNWTACLILSAGQNIVQVYAEDAAGNRSTTNSVTLTDDSTGLVAPESLAGTMLELDYVSNGSAVLSFYGSTFSEVRTNGGPTGVGAYTYTLTNANSGQLATVFTAGRKTVAETGGGVVINLSFNNGTSGTWYNTNGDSGTFTLSDASSTAPDSVSGLTVQGVGTWASSNVVYQFTNEYFDGFFTNTTGSSSGTYTYAQFSPEVGVVQEIFTDEADLGTTNDIMLDFSTGSNTYYIGSDTANSTNTGLGTFSVSGETSTEGYTAPVSLAGLTGPYTYVHTNGTRESGTMSFGASTFGQFDMNTNQYNPFGVGTYTFTRTGPKTALSQTIGLAPPETAGPTSLTSNYFTGSHSVNFTNSGGHGTFTFSQTASTVPLSIVGRQFTGHPSNGGGGTYSFDYGTFSGSGAADGQAGTYTYAIYGPQVAMGILNFTSGRDAGTTQYVEWWFSSATGGKFWQDNISNNVTVGTFTMK